MTPKIEAVQKMQDYIAEHQTEEINLSDLANTACYSPWYCYRIFKELTGMSVSDYVRRLKLTGAARRLKESDAKVIDVALDSGFESVDGFQRAFYRLQWIACVENLFVCGFLKNCVPEKVNMFRVLK